MKPIIKKVSLVKLAAIVVITSLLFSGLAGQDTYLGFSIIFFAEILFLMVLRGIGLIGEISTDEGARYFNWVNWAIVVLAAALISDLAWDAWQISSGNYVAMALGLLFIVGVSIYLFRAFRKTKKVEIDERTRDITNRSARNAFIMVLWGLLLSGASGITTTESGTYDSSGNYIVVSRTEELVNPLDAEKVLIVVAVALLVFLASLYIYRHKSA